MAKNLKVKLNRAGVSKLMKSPEMLQICKDFAYEAQSRLGDGYEVSYRIGKKRANAEIKAVSKKAIRENFMKNTILKALRG